MIEWQDIIYQDISSYERPAPLITIGITCFNAKDSIERALTSALHQDYPNTEIIIVDDSSADNSVQIIESLQKTHRHIQLVQQAQNQGYPAALNKIIECAKGKYIAFFDDDDDNAPDRVSAQYQRLSTFQSIHPDKPVICYTNRAVYVNGIEQPGAKVKAIGRQAPEPHGEMVADYILLHKETPGFHWGEFGSCTMMAATQTLRQFGFDPDFRRSAEWDFAIRIAQQGGYFIAVDKPLVLQHKTPTSDKAGRKPLDYALKLRKKYKGYFSSKMLYGASICLTYSRFYYFRQQYWKSRLYLLSACFLAPAGVLWPHIFKKIQIIPTLFFQ